MAHDPALELDIAPEPEPDAAAALSRAVAQVAHEARLGEPAALTSPWRRQALRELTDDRMDA